MSEAQARALQAIYGGEVDSVGGGFYRLVVTGRSTVTVFDAHGVYQWSTHRLWVRQCHHDNAIYLD